MRTELLHALNQCETDVDGAIKRFSGNESLYISCLCAFLSDNTMAELTKAIGSSAWDDAFTAAHALKGLAGNMGFIPLFHAAAELVVLIRAGRIPEAVASHKKVLRCYNEVSGAIQACDEADEAGKRGAAV